MTIIHIISSFTGGGAERFVVSLCNQLSKNKSLDIHLISLFDVKPDMFLHKQVNSNVSVHTLSKKMGFDASIFFKLYRLIKTIKPNVAHTHLRAFNYNYLNLLFYNNATYFHTLHSDAILECPSVKNRNLRRVFYKKKVTPISISEASSKSFKKAYNLKNDILIYNGREAVKPTQSFNTIKAEVNGYKQNQNTKVFINIANLLPVKGQINLTKAFSKFIDNGANAILLIIGDRRPNDDDIYNTIQQFKGKNIYYLGKKTNIEDYLLCANAFVLSSTIEGMPITIIEALSCGCIPIATPVGGLPNMITHGKNGLLTKDTSVNSLYNALKHFMDLDKDALKTLKENAIDSYNSYYTIEKSAIAYQKLYDKHY